MMQSCASAAKLRGGRPILNHGSKTMCEVGLPPPRFIIRSSPSRRQRCGSSAASRHTGRTARPAGISPVVTNLQSAMRSLCQGHYHGLAQTGAATCSSRPIPRGQRAVLLMHQETPSDVDHPTADAGIAGPRKSSLTSLLTARVRSTCEARISRNGLPIPQLSGEDFVNKHVRGLNADANHAAQEADPCRAMMPWLLLEPFSTCPFNLLDLLPHKTQTREVTAHFRQCVRRQGNALGGT